MIYFGFIPTMLLVNVSYYIIIITRIRVMMYFLYKLVCFLIYIDKFSMYILTELKCYFVIED